MVCTMTEQMNNTSDLMLHGWEVHPTVLIGCVALLVWYFVARPQETRRTIFFVSGVTVLCLSLISPIDPLGDQYLFSAHMMQHLLLILIVPPMLLLGITKERLLRWRRYSTMRRAESMLGRPSIAWSSNMLMMVVWHIPALYNAANANTSIHILEHMTFLITGCMFWWPIFTPLTEERLRPAAAMLYLFGAAVVSTLLGIIITFLPVGHYQPYLHPSDELGALHLVRQTWGISAAEDEKLAGLLMWVPGCTVYFVVLLLELGRWYQTPDLDKQAMLASLNNSPPEVRHG
jgi:putative membrane protein